MVDNFSLPKLEGRGYMPTPCRSSLFDPQHIPLPIFLDTPLFCCLRFLSQLFGLKIKNAVFNKFEKKLDKFFMCTFTSPGGNSEETRRRGTENCRGERPLLAETNRRSRETKN